MRAMDENFNPNRDVYGHGALNGSGKASGNHTTGSNDMEAVAGVDAPLIAVLGGLEDGEVAVVGDLMAVRAGPETYHPIKALKGMASESDLILLSCLTKAPAPGEATSAVRSVLQRVIVRTPSAMIHNTRTRGTPAGMATAAVGAGPAPHLRVICPSAHSAVVDGKLLRAFTAERARTILAKLSPLPAAGAPELPTVVAGVADGPSGLCFLGQRATSEGFSAFSIRREPEPERGSGTADQADQAIRIDDLMYEYGGRAHASARALYDLWGTSNGDMLGGCFQEGVDPGPFSRLATEWDCSSHASRTLGSVPPPACSSLLLVGGRCPSNVVSLAIRGDIEVLSTAAAVGRAAPPRKQCEVKGPFADVGGGDHGTGAVASAGSGPRDEAEKEGRERWDEELQALLSGSENMAELATKPRNDDGDDKGGAEGRGRPGEEDTAVQERKDGGGIGEEEIGTGRDEQSETFRGDLDFSERLWQLAARAADVEGVRSAFTLAFDAVGEGHLFPVVNRDNQTAIGGHIRAGVGMAREARYHDARSVGVGVSRDEAKAKAWRERGSAMLKNTESLAEVFVELGAHKVARDLFYWLETHAGVLAADIDRVLPTAASDKLSNAESGEGRATPTPTDRRLGRLVTLTDTLDLVALAQSYGAPWRQVRALAHGGLATLRRATTATEAGSSFSTPSPVFPLGLPKPIPLRARSKLAHPFFWELFLEPMSGAGGEDATAGLTSPTETVSYVMVAAGVFQCKGLDEPPVLSGGAARAAQAALEGCPAHLVPEVLSSVTGVESFLALKRRQQERRVKGLAVGEDATATFVCEHRFTPW